MKVNIVGSIFSQTGYSTHTRFLAEALEDAGFEIGIECERPQGWEFGCPDKLFKMLARNHTRETTIMISTPPYYDFKWADGPKHLIGFVIWEGDCTPKFWLKHLQKCDQLWVPSRHVMNALVNTFKKEDLPPIFVVPHGVDHAYFYPAKTQEDRPFTFILNKGWSEGMEDRGGVQYVLQAFIREFSSLEDLKNVKLLAKINTSYKPISPAMTSVLSLLNIPALPSNIELIDENMPFKDLVRIYQRADCFVCPTRAEAFNLPGLESMACRLPTIQTGFGGQVDYMNDENSWMIEYDLTLVTHNRLYEGVKWATPRIDDLKAKMRYAVEHPEEIKKKGEQALKDSFEWSWKNSAMKAAKALYLLK